MHHFALFSKQMMILLACLNCLMDDTPLIAQIPELRYEFNYSAWKVLGNMRTYVDQQTLPFRSMLTNRSSEPGYSRKSDSNSTATTGTR